MSTSEIILFEFGTEGGGATVSKLSTNKIIEKGSSGGILDEDEDPIREWEEVYDNWEDWWSNFIAKHKAHWICFYPVYIHEDIKIFIQTAVENYQDSDEFLTRRKATWLRRLNVKSKL